MSLSSNLVVSDRFLKCSVLIGLTLAVTEDYTVLFVVILFHRTYPLLG